jgi:hypothetical protein
MALIPSKRMHPTRLSKIGPLKSPDYQRQITRLKGVCMKTKSILAGGAVMGILAIIAGVLVLIWPELVRWIIGIFLIVWGVLAIINRK